jgi:hypothetical protein
MVQLCSRRTGALVLVFLLSVGVVGAVAQHAAKGNANGHEDVTVGSAGQQVAIDAKTGKFRAPTPEELQILTAPMANNQSSEGLVVKSGPNGLKTIDLDGRFENFTMVKIGPDGKLVSGCVTTEKEAKDFLTAEPSKKPTSDPSTWEDK